MKDTFIDGVQFYELSGRITPLRDMHYMKFVRYENEILFDEKGDTLFRSDLIDTPFRHDTIGDSTGRLAV